MKISASMSGTDFNQRDGLILAYKGYVRNLVAGLIRLLNLPPSYFDDFTAAGYLGLVEAADTFDFERGTDFRTYAFYRIRGSVIDTIRSCSELQGKAYRLSKALEAVQGVREMMRHDDEIEDPAKQNNAIARLLEYADKGALAYRLSLCEAEAEVLAIPDESPTPQESVLLREGSNRLRKLVRKLPKQERVVVEQYYFAHKSFDEIGEEQGLGTKSWCSRLHAKALIRLRRIVDEAEDAN